MASETSDSAPRQRHLVLFYRGLDEYCDAVTRFARDGLSAGARVLVAVPEYHLRALRTALRSEKAHAGDRLGFADMSILGRNPARIIPAVLAFIAADNNPVHFVGEPIWPGRSAAEVTEATRHEALINLAFARSDVEILCPYDAARLPEPVLADARQTHPPIVWRQAQDPVADAGAAEWVAGIIPEGCCRPLTPPPSRAQAIQYHADLRTVREFASRLARAVRLPAEREGDLVLAVNEIAANTLRHSGAGGIMRGWQAPGELICELSDAGHITDPLAGRHMPDPEQAGGHGLWLVNRSVDLTEIRSGPEGTVIRVHVRCPARDSSKGGSASYDAGDGRDDRRGVDACRL